MKGCNLENVGRDLCNGRSNEIETTATKEKIVERIEEMSEKEEQIDAWEKMRQEFKRRQREDRRRNPFQRKNETFPKQLGETTRRQMPRKRWLSGDGSTTRMPARGGETT